MMPDSPYHCPSTIAEALPESENQSVMKQTVSEQALTLVEKKIHDLKGELTPQDAAAATGVTVGEARDALTRLMELYITRITYDNQGNVLFAFEMPLRARGTKTAAERWADTKQRLWRWFKRFYKIWIGTMVIVYFGVMALALIAILVAFMIATKSDDDDNPVAGLVGGLFRVMLEGLQFAFWMTPSPAMGYAVDDHGYRYRTAKTPKGIKKSKDGKEEKSFIIAIYDLALGPERVAADPLENEQEVAAFLQAERGILSPSEIVGLSGGTLSEAEERMADYLVRFNGDPTITEDGAVIGEFESYLLGRTTDAATGKIIPYWEEFEAPFEHSGNAKSRNVWIVLMVLFTMVVGLGMLFGGGLNILAVYGRFFYSSLAAFFLGYLPIAFSLSYVAISLLRLPGAKRREAERLQRNREKRVMRTIFQDRLWRATSDQIYFAMVASGGKEISREETTSILQNLLPKLQGDIELNENGEPIYTFPRLQREIEAAEKMRVAK